MKKDYEEDEWKKQFTVCPAMYLMPFLKGFFYFPKIKVCIWNEGLDLSKEFDGMISNESICVNLKSIALVN